LSSRPLQFSRPVTRCFQPYLSWKSISQGPDGSELITLSSRPQALPVHGQ
jgi:hypothetical protein